MLKFVKWSFCSFIFLTLFAACLKSQDYVYTNNDTSNGTNNISGYSVASDGTSSQISGSPFTTGQMGTSSTSVPLAGANRIIIFNHFLYASNAGSNTISAFAIDLSNNGALVPIGSAVSILGQDDPSISGISLAATPDGKFLYAGATGFSQQCQSFGSITIFSVQSNGALSNTLPCVAADGPIYSMKVTPSGKFLVLAFNNLTASSDPYGLDVFAIQSDGTLNPVAGSPFLLSNFAVTSVDVNCASTLVFAGRASVPDIDVFNIGTDGTLSELSNSPFSTSSGSYQVVALSKDDSTLFSSNPGAHTVTAFPVLIGVTGSPDGTLDVANATSAAAAGTSGKTVFSGPGGLAVSDDSAFLYAADTIITGAVGAVSTFGLGGSTPLTFDSLIFPVPDPYPSGQFSKMQSVAAYPAKACAPPPPANSLTASLQIFTAPPLGFDLEATLSLDSSLTVDPLTQAVVIQIGDFTLTLPAGSLRLFQNGSKAGTYVAVGPEDGTILMVQITPLGQNQFQISANGKKTDLTGTGSPVMVTAGIGGNSASASVEPSFTSRSHGKPSSGN